MDDEGVVPGVDKAEGHREARNHCTYGEAHDLSVHIILGLPIFDLVGTQPGFRAYHQINAHEAAVLDIEAGG